MKKTLLAAAMISTLGATTAATAASYTFSGTGYFTMLSPTGAVLANPDYSANPYYGYRSDLTGLSMTFETTTGVGSGSVDPFLFSGTTAVANGITMQAIGDGNGNPGTLVMGQISFDYGPTTGIPVYLVADAAGLFGALGGGLTVGQVITGGAVSTTDAAVGATPFAGYMPSNGALGAIPFAMTSLDVNQDGDPGNACGTTGSTGALLSGGFPLCNDGKTGVRMATAPFPGHGANFDMTSMTLVSCSNNDGNGNCVNTPPIPVPAAVWLFGSGLLGLVGVARRRKSA
jgi:hypothetical protein